jgi:glucokinase
MPKPTSHRFELPLFVGVDVGGTNIKVGLVDSLGAIVASSKFPTQQELGPQHAMKQSRRVLDQLFESLPFSWDDVAAAGLGTPGPMDIAAGMILTPSNLPAWHNFHAQDALSRALDKPVAFANDAAAAAYGEFWVGAGRLHDSIVLLTLGTGVGGGIIIHDMSIDGSHSHGGEVGHIVIDTSPQARICSCGHKGHLEAYASASGIVARTREALVNHRNSVLSQQIGEASPLSALMISEAAAAGDDLACQIVSETAMYLGRGITTLAHVIDPSAFFLGGAVDFGGAESRLGRKFLNEVIDEVKQNSFPVIANRLTIEFAQLGSEAGFVGAAGLGRLEFLKRTRHTPSSNAGN